MLFSYTWHSPHRSQVHLLACLYRGTVHARGRLPKMVSGLVSQTLLSLQRPKNNCPVAAKRRAQANPKQNKRRGGTTEPTDEVLRERVATIFCWTVTLLTALLRLLTTVKFIRCFSFLDECKPAQVHTAMNIWLSGRRFQHLHVMKRDKSPLPLLLQLHALSLFGC